MMIFETGDIVVIKEHKTSTHYVVLNHEGDTFLLNQEDSPIKLTDSNYEKVMKKVEEVWRAGERVFPRGKLTKEEKDELKALSRYFTEDTCVIKVPEGLMGITSYIRITGLASAKHGREDINLPSFITDKYYKGLNCNTVYPINELMRS